MESELHMQLELSNRMPVVNDGIPPQMLSESLLRSSFCQLGTQNENMIGRPVLSSFQGEPFKNLHASRHVSYDGLLNRGNSIFHELCLGGSSLPSGSLGSILASRNSLNNDLISSVVPLQQEVPSESLREMLSSNCSYASSSSVPTRINCGYESLLGEANGKWDQNRFLIQPDSWRASTSGLEPMRSTENQDGNQWVLSNSANVCSSLPYGIPMSHNELSLSLATCEASLSCSASAQGCCSDMSCSSVICNSQSQARLGSDRGSQGNRELSLEFASNSRPPQFSHEMISGSKYLTALQQILSELARFSLAGIEQTSCSTGLVGSSSNSLVSSKQFNYSRISFKGASGCSGDDESFEAPAESSSRRQEVDAKKSQLLSLLELVDDCYTRCLDEIHRVISAFHAASELDPRLHPCFALQTVSSYYKNLREKISNEILAMGMDNGSRKDNMKSFEKAFIQKQWALQQLKRKDQQLWRPQRGLPERSVSVLRAWMFENFLHPYPKDAEKHLLAIKSGLTRSQVSNWFINARVRLWKPLVEEMCAELNRRKGVHQNDEVTNGSNTRRSHISIILLAPMGICRLTVAYGWIISDLVSWNSVLFSLSCLNLLVACGNAYNVCDE